MRKLGKATKAGKRGGVGGRRGSRGRTLKGSGLGGGDDGGGEGVRGGHIDWWGVVVGWKGLIWWFSFGCLVVCLRGLEGVGVERMNGRGEAGRGRGLYASRTLEPAWL